MNNLKNIKDLLSDFEMKYDPNDWIRLEKDLPKPKKTGNISGTVIISSVAVLAVVGVLLFSVFNKDKNINTVNTVIESETKNDFNNNIITPQIHDLTSDNAELYTQNKNQSVNEILSDDENHDIFKNDINNKDQVITISEDINKKVDESNVGIYEPQNNINIISEFNENKTEITTPDLNNTNFKVEIVTNCTPSRVIFSAENIPSDCKVLWNTGNSLIDGNYVEHTYSQSGKYFPEVSISYNNFILRKESLPNIEIYPTDPVNIIIEKTENDYHFSTDIIDGGNITWSIDGQTFNSDGISYDFKEPGKYKIYLNAINKYGCKSVAEQTIDVIFETVFFVPNAFIPDNDNINSYFGPIGENMNFREYQFTIVDMFGNVVFKTTDVGEFWNGKINNIGDDAKAGYYFWEIKGLDTFNKIQSQKGRVNLIRN